MDLFQSNKKDLLRTEAPLAARMRPESLDEFVGQDHILGPGRLLRRSIIADQLSSLIFYGPPGTGKTTLARIIANTTKSEFISMNAVLAGVKNIKEAIAQAEENLSYAGRRSILFVDEVHRFNKGQQDALLPHVENGTILFIGATTENPYFEVNKALVSRSRIFQLKSLNEEDLLKVAKLALTNSEKGFGRRKIKADEEALLHLVRVANGDARSVLNALELAVNSTEGDQDGIVNITIKVAEESIQQRAVLYDKDGDAHYDTISAFIKSIRGSDPDAALYWLAKMVYAGEDPKFIFRRLLILASEDIGLADPNALTIVNAAAQAYDYVGMPEGQFHLSQAVLYLSTCEKSNSTMSYFSALQSVQEEKTAEVPDPLKDGSRDKEGFGHGVGYKYPHAFQEHWVAQNYLPESLQGKVFYSPGQLGYEGLIKEKVEKRKEIQLSVSLERNNLELEGVNYFDLSHAPAVQTNWEKRAFGSQAEYFEKCREIIFKQADVKPDSFCLDLRFGSGLISWELLRKIRNQNIYSVFHEKNESDLFRNYENTKDPKKNLIRVFADKNNILKSFLEKENELPQFDFIFGFRCIHQLGLPNFSEIIKNMGLTSKIVLLEKLPYYAQRPSQYLDQMGYKENLEALQEIEEIVFCNHSNNFMNLRKNDISNIFLDMHKEIELREVLFCEKITITSSYIERLFPESSDSKQKSYAQLLHSKMNKEEILHWKSVMLDQLLNKEIVIENLHHLLLVNN